MPKISDHLAEAIEARRKELGLTPQQLAERTGLSSTALKNIRRGEVRRYQERLTIPLTTAFGWTSDSISRLLAGDEPVLVERLLREREHHLDHLEEWDDPNDALRVAEVRAEIERLRTQLSAQYRRPAPRSRGLSSLVPQGEADRALPDEISRLPGLVEQLAGRVAQLERQVDSLLRGQEAVRAAIEASGLGDATASDR